MSIVPIQFSELRIQREKVLVRLGYAAGKTKIDAKIQDILEEEISAAKKLFVPRQVIATSAVERQGLDTVFLRPGLSIISADISKLLTDCAEAAGFAVTIGPALETRRDKYLKERETTRALILDAVGSVTAEELAEITDRQLQAEAAARGFSTTRRYSPGYGDWALTGQKEFLLWLGAAQIGIKLSESFQMIPEKSVSALMGFKRKI